MKISKDIQACLTKVEQGLDKGLQPVLSSEGTSGSYIMRSGQDESPVAVFKPIDEEPFAPNNPRGMQANFGSETCRPGVKSGESTLREAYAYMLDHDNFAGVPPTCLVRLTHESIPQKPVDSL